MKGEFLNPLIPSELNQYPAIWDASDSEILITVNSDFLNTLGEWFLSNKTITICEIPIRNIGFVHGGITRMRTPGKQLQSNKCRLGLYNSLGIRIGMTGPLGVSWETPENPDGTGTKIKMPFLETPIPVVPGKFYVAFLVNYAGGNIAGSPTPVEPLRHPPGFSRGAANQNCNIGYEVSPWRFSKLPPNQDVLPPQIDLNNLSYSEEAVYVGLY